MSKQQRRVGKKIERAIAAEDWAHARRLIREQLRCRPDDHWLLTRLSLTYYEQKQYEKSLQYSVAALQIAPYCPLAVWDYAVTLDMLKRRTKALQLHRWIISWGEKQIAYGECGEGIRSARSLIADCYYRIGRIHEDRRERLKALSAYRQHLRRRKPGVWSIYPLVEVKKRVTELNCKRILREERSGFRQKAPARQERALTPSKRLKLSPAGPIVLHAKVCGSRSAFASG